MSHLHMTEWVEGVLIMTMRRAGIARGVLSPSCGQRSAQVRAHPRRPVRVGPRTVAHGEGEAGPHSDTDSALRS